MNWSAVACDAFEAKLEEMGPIEEITSIEGALKRIKNISVEKDQNYEQGLSSGEEVGRHWALNTATPEQLKRIEELKAKIEDDSDTQWNEYLTEGHGRRRLAKCVGFGMDFSDQFFGGRGRGEHGPKSGRGRGSGPRRRGHGGKGGHGRGGHGARREGMGGPRSGRKRNWGQGDHEDEMTQMQKWKMENQFHERLVWRSILNERPSHISFFLGFANAALKVWDELKGKLD